MWFYRHVIIMIITWQRFLVSDMKQVIYTIEMILWSIILNRKILPLSGINQCSARPLHFTRPSKSFAIIECALFNTISRHRKELLVRHIIGLLTNINVYFLKICGISYLFSWTNTESREPWRRHSELKHLHRHKWRRYFYAK